MKRAPTLLLALAPVLLPACAQHQGGRIRTSRPVHAAVPVPATEEAFTFAIVGDRTGGPAAGIHVLEQAVEDLNLLDPDLVMTVGDLVQGYNTTPEWRQQAQEYRETMAGLRMPWYPVAGNHDLYWGGPDRPPGEHEADYEAVFGPLWYAFRHGDAWFVVLDSDEGDPETGVKDWQQPSAQRMGPEQYDWLRGVLQRACGARYVFVFLHHPRWHLEAYGDDWERVHRLLAAAGNVRAVFAGHVHHMQYDGVRDGIEYLTLATTGGQAVGEDPRAGFLHEFHLVTVRGDRVSMAAIPVGAVLDPRALGGAQAAAD